MINLLLPPLYQQHTFAQPQPQLYEPLPPPATPSVNTISLRSANETMDASSQSLERIQSESPSILPTMSPSVANLQSDNQTTDDVAEPVTEKQLKFRPVQKKINGRNVSRYLFNFSTREELRLFKLISIFSELKLGHASSKFTSSITQSYQELI